MAAVALASSPRAQALRVGVFADGPLQPRWAVEALAAAAAAGCAEIVAVSAGAAAPPPAAAGWWKLYRAFDRAAFGAGGAHEERVELARHLPQARGASHAGLDVAFALGELDDARLDGLARYGVWRFYGDGLREVVDGAPLTPSGVKVRLAAGAAPRLAYQSWARTHPFSVERNRAHLAAKAAQFAVRALAEVQRGGRDWLEQCPPAEEAPSPARGPLPLLGRIARRGLEKATCLEQWSLALRFDLEGEPSGDLSGWQRLVPPKDRDWADPFALEKDGRYYVFFEELPYAAGRAHISVIEVRRDGACSPPQRVLERDYHLSYPFVFEHEGALFMVPESAQNRTVELYRCVEFPLRWKLERVLLREVRLVDATLHRDARGWWMFANAAPGSSRTFDDELHLFHAERLHGEWRAHARNPVRSDARCARPAGRLYSRDGALYRPAQICVPRYGAGLSLNRVLELGPDAYAEREALRVLPDPASGILGLHTLNRAGPLCVLDAFARRRRFA